MVTVAMKLKDAWKKSYDEPRQHIKKQRHYFAKKVPKTMVFPIVMYLLESWTLKKAECQKLMLLKCGVEEDS